MKKDDITFDTIMEFSPDNKDVFEEILEHLKSNNLVPFVGAGLSSFVYPCWSDFLKEIAKKLSERDYDSIEFLLKEFKYEEAASLLCDKRGYANFNADISRIFSETKINEVNLYKQAVYILPKLFNNLVITTNIDRILERVFSENKKEIFSCYPGNPEPFISVMKRGTPTIFKIHGDISSKNNLVLTKEQYDETYVEDCTLIDQLSQCFENKIHLFLGCSLQADRTVPILENIQEKQNRVVPDYAIYPCSASDKHAKIQSFGQRGIRAILYPENNHHSVRIVLEALLERIDRDEYLKLEYCNGKRIINSPIQRYQYDAETVDFFGRENEMNQLLAFCENNNNVHLQWWAITGDGGCGKSRLGLELKKKLNSIGWESYIHDKMDFTDLKATSRKICKNTIFIIDSIETYPEEVGKWIESLNQPTSTIRKRIILIAREGNNIKTPWVKSMKKSCLSDNMLNEICYQNEFLRLSSLPKDITKDIIKNYAASVHESIDDEQVDKIYQGLEKIDRILHRPLYALILVDTYFENNYTMPQDLNSVLEVLVLREIKIISNLLKAKINASDDQFEELILRIKVVATIVRGIDVNNLENYLDTYDYNLLYEKLKKYNNDDLISFLKKIYVVEDNGNLIKPIKPDLIGEYFVVHVLKSEMRFELLQALIKKAWYEQRRTHDYLSRMALTYNTLLLENTELYNVITTNPGKDRIGWYLSLLCELMANSRIEVFLKIKETFLSEISKLSSEERQKECASLHFSATFTYTLADSRLRDEKQRRSMKTKNDMESDEFDCLSMKNTAAALYYGSIMLGNDSYLVKNDYAYMLRRKEVNQPYGLTVEEVLKDSILAKESFPLVNMALHYAMNRSSKEDWSQADELLAMIAEDEVKSIESYWTGMANRDEDEGFLVLLWLCRHGFVETTKYGDQERLFLILKDRVDTIPNWMKEKAFIKNSTEIY